MHTAQAYPARRANPGQVPLYAPGASATERNIVDNSFQVNYKLHHDENTIDLALIERFLAMMPEKWNDAMRERTSTMANPTFLQVFQVAIRHQKIRRHYTIIAQGKS